MNMQRTLRLSLTAVLGFFVAVAVLKIGGCTPEAVPLKRAGYDPNAYTPAKTSVVDEQFNFHAVTPFLWRSGQPSEESFLRMKQHGLKTVINLRHEEQNNPWEKELAEKMGLQYYYFPMDAGKDHDLGQITEILEVIKDPANQPVLIHCHGGKDRTGLVTAIYKIEYTDQDFNDIYKEMLMFGYHQERYPAVLRSIKRWCEGHGHPEIAEKISPDGRSVSAS